MAQILREMNEATFVDNFFDANKPMSKIKADARKYGITIKVKKGGGQMGADQATLSGSESGIIKYAQNHLDASKKVRNLRDLKKELGEIVNPDGERRRAKKKSQLGDPIKIHGDDKEDDKETNEDAVANAQKRLDKAKKIADLKKQINTVRSESVGDDAERLGLDHLGFGRYGKDGKMTHKSDGDKLVKADPKDIEDFEKKKDQDKSDEPKKDEPKRDTPRQDSSPKTNTGKLLDRMPNESLGEPEDIKREFEEITVKPRVEFHGDGTTEMTFKAKDGGMDLSMDYQSIVDSLEEKGLKMGSDYYIEERTREDEEMDEEITVEIKVRVIPDMADFESDEEEDEYRKEWKDKHGKYGYFDNNRYKGESVVMDHYVTAISRMNEAVAQKDAFVVTGGKGDNDQKIIGVFKDEKSAKKARDDYNKKNRPAKKSHFARIYKQTRLSQAGKRFKPGEKIGYMTYSNKAQFTKLKEALDDDDKETIKPIIKQLKKSVKAHDKQAKQLTKDIEDEINDAGIDRLKRDKKAAQLRKDIKAIGEDVEDLEEFTDAQIERLRKEYQSLKGKETGINPEKFKKLRGMMKRFPKANLLKLVKADIPVLTTGAKAALVMYHGMKWKSLPEDFLPYIDIFADDNQELSEVKKGKFKEVDPKVIDRIEKMMRGSRAEKDSIANMLNYFMPPEVVDMVRYKLKIVPKRGKIKF